MRKILQNYINATIEVEKLRSSNNSQDNSNTNPDFILSEDEQQEKPNILAETEGEERRPWIHGAILH